MNKYDYVKKNALACFWGRSLSLLGGGLFENARHSVAKKDLIYSPIFLPFQCN